jgi:N-acetylglutamate synthase-like GNAT family acetyltransferase
MYDHAELQMVCVAPAESGYRDIEIIEARESDIEELSILGTAAFDRDRESEEDMIRNSIASDDRTQYIAKHDGRMVGLCAAAECGGKMMIFGLGVHPDERRKGYARALLNHIAFEALKRGIKEL